MSLGLNAQQQLIPLNKAFNFGLNKAILNSDTLLHFGFAPFVQSRIQVENVEELVPNLKYYLDTNHTFTSRKLFHEHVTQYQNEEVQFTIDPLVNFEFGREFSDESREQQLYKNTRGFLLRLNLGSKVSVQSTFRENQVELPSTFFKRTRFSRVAYGQGRVKKFNETGFDFAMASSNISYSPNDLLNIQVGHGKHFVGYGHRSLLLSDLAFTYPFLKINSLWFNKKLQYQNLFSSFQDLNRIQTDFEGEGLFERKQGVFHYLDYSVNSRLKIGLFEGFVTQSLDTSGNVPVPVSYYAPVILFNSMLHSEDSLGNSLIGLNLSLKALNNLQFYGQLAGYSLGEDFGVQLGLNYYLNFLPIKIQLEYNSSSTRIRQNQFNHYGESLNFSYLSGTKELLSSLVFKKGRFLSQVTGSLIENNSINSLVIDGRQSFIINPIYNLTFNLGLQYRERSSNGYSENYLYIGVSTNLQNLYFDY